MLEISGRLDRHYTPTIIIINYKLKTFRMKRLLTDISRRGPRRKDGQDNQRNDIGNA